MEAKEYQLQADEVNRQIHALKAQRSRLDEIIQNKHRELEALKSGFNVMNRPLYSPNPSGASPFPLGKIEKEDEIADKLKEELSVFDSSAVQSEQNPAPAGNTLKSIK